ncbi:MULTISPECIES: cellulase family glycosylhydrolase [unclassified Streptomyces]|uniref:cellulase family glycosylhydrolase n=1 Tax=unclassified Streptomyces TaxID=2593676 RepID=UPI002DD9B31E|nr:cellulase family glycosylhydrolase [Streptomyces sp. NBC_01750]WSA98688.1 glycoside hydrolase family 5 protein [Streptomyces sp. NBC_01794]WSD36742.1 glycoside hydrolase family 5 protein [Streptomyces sp. NBC_01750]
MRSAPILVGTRAWSSLGVSEDSDGTEIVNNPVNASHIMYTFHLCAASHGAEYLGTLSRAADRLPMFVTEFGTQTASGGTGPLKAAGAWVRNRTRTPGRLPDRLTPAPYVPRPPM